MDVMTEAIPRIIKIFKILLPTTFPTVMPALPFKAAVILTAASGALVPMATIVRPITNCGMPNLSAIPDVPSTNQSAPFTSSTKPSANNSNSTNNISFPPIIKYVARSLIFVVSTFIPTKKRLHRIKNVQ